MSLEMLADYWNNGYFILEVICRESIKMQKTARNLVRAVIVDYNIIF
jgi:hypothetical protein